MCQSQAPDRILERLAGATNLICRVLDHAVDHLHSGQTQLRNCCLIFKPWIPRPRRNLEPGSISKPQRPRIMEEGIPDSSTSLSHYAKTLFIRCSEFEVVTTRDGGVGCWVSGFPRVLYLVIVGRERFARGWGDTLTLFHGSSPGVRSLQVNLLLFYPSHIIFLFPLLEDPSVVDWPFARASRVWWRLR